MTRTPIMSPNDVSTLLKIKESTLRKYSLLLEDVGHTFQRNNQNQRWYNDTDIVVLKKLISLKNSTDMNLKDCAEAVFQWSNSQNITQPLTVSNNVTERRNDDMKELKEMVSQQTSIIQQLVKRMDQQQKYIDERLEKRDREWLEFVRRNQEEKRLLLEVAAAQEEERKKGFFAKLFGK